MSMSALFSFVPKKQKKKARVEGVMCKRQRTRVSIVSKLFGTHPTAVVALRDHPRKEKGQQQPEDKRMDTDESNRETSSVFR